MITKTELETLLRSTETDRVERTISVADKDKFGAAICAFANDLPGHGKNGYLLIGVYDDGRRSGLKATDELLKDLSAMRNDGNILPLPMMNVGFVPFDDGDVVVVEVAPSILPPVRYHGRTWIRVGPRKGIATVEEEQVLIERRRGKFPTFDSMPCQHATLEDLNLEAFKHIYLPKAFDAETLAAEERPIERQLEALNFYSTEYNCPTNAGVIVFGKNPTRFLPGDYIQFVQFAGTDRAGDILNQQQFRGGLIKVLPEIDVFVKTAIAKSRPEPVTVLREEERLEYPRWAIRELAMNAIMHRDYQSNAPTMFYQYCDRLELLNSGGLYGRARDFPNENDYRNPIIADVVKTLGYVNCFGRGIGRVGRELVANGNGEPIFAATELLSFRVTVKLHAESILTQPESRPIAPESAPSKAESAPSKPVFGQKSASSPEESAPIQLESALSCVGNQALLDQVTAWAELRLSGIRADARQNMVKVLKAIALSGMYTQEQMANHYGMSLRGIKKITSALQKIGLIAHDGRTSGAVWKLVGFKKITIENIK